MNRRMPGGFTLTELVLVIVITGVLAAIVAPLIIAPVQSYFDATRRSALVYSADMALRRMARDVHRALPYSLRLNPGGTAAEMILVRDAGRYRENGGAASRRLTANGNDDEFNIVGFFQAVSPPYSAGADEYLVVFNLGTAGADAYAGDSVIHGPGNFDISSETYTIGGTSYTEHKLSATNGTTFPFVSSSPSHRVFLTRGEVSYGCSGGYFYRYSSYGFSSSMPSLATIATGDVLADQVTSCSFSYDPGSTTRPALLMVNLVLSSGSETVRLQHQVHVPNAT